MTSSFFGSCSWSALLNGAVVRVRDRVEEEQPDLRAELHRLGLHFDLNGRDAQPMVEAFVRGAREVAMTVNRKGNAVAKYLGLVEKEVNVCVDIATSVGARSNCTDAELEVAAAVRVGDGTRASEVVYRWDELTDSARRLVETALQSKLENVATLGRIRRVMLPFTPAFVVYHVLEQYKVKTWGEFFQPGNHVRLIAHVKREDEAADRGHMMAVDVRYVTTGDDRKLLTVGVTRHFELTERHRQWSRGEMNGLDLEARSDDGRLRAVLRRGDELAACSRQVTGQAGEYLYALLSVYETRTAALVGSYPWFVRVGDRKPRVTKLDFVCENGYTNVVCLNRNDTRLLARQVPTELHLPEGYRDRRHGAAFVCAERFVDVAANHVSKNSEYSLGSNNCQTMAQLLWTRFVTLDEAIESHERTAATRAAVAVVMGFTAVAVPLSAAGGPKAMQVTSRALLKSHRLFKEVRHNQERWFLEARRLEPNHRLMRMAEAAQRLAGGSSADTDQS